MDTMGVVILWNLWAVYRAQERPATDLRLNINKPGSNIPISAYILLKPLSQVMAKAA